MVLLWQFGSQDPENAKNFSMIAEWWTSLNAKSVLWKQRLIKESGEIDWSPQKFDETVVLAEADVRGITLYWKKSESEDLGDITPQKMEFHPVVQRLYLYPETQKNLVISVEIPGAIRNSVKIKNPAWLSEKLLDEADTVIGYRIIILDDTKQTEVQIEMDEGNLNYLKHAIDTL
jgi:hypothetical protein